MGKIQSPSAQKRIYCEHKGKNCVKMGILCNGVGKVIMYTPPSASMDPTAGDGNLLTLQLDYEINGRVRNSFDSFLRPANKKHSVLAFMDYGYEVNVGLPQTRGTALTMRDYFYNPQRPGYNPNSRYFSIIKPGGPLLGPDLRPINNPYPAGGRTKLSTSEANVNRTTTLYRFPIELCNGGSKQNGIVDDRVADTKYFDPIGKWLPGHEHISKREIIWNNVFSLHNR